MMTVFPRDTGKNTGWSIVSRMLRPKTFRISRKKKLRGENRKPCHRRGASLSWWRRQNAAIGIVTSGLLPPPPDGSLSYTPVQQLLTTEELRCHVHYSDVLSSLISTNSFALRSFIFPSPSHSHDHHYYLPKSSLIRCLNPSRNPSSKSR